jgi:general secretion pathway protein H
MQNAKLKKSIHCSLLTVYCPKGFTLIELLVVLIIIATASALVGIALYRGSGNLELKTFTRDISATLRYARSHAISEKKIYTFLLWEDKRAYGLYADLPYGDIEDKIPVIYKPIPEQLQPVFKNRGSSIRIDFFPLGNSTGGVIEIESREGKGFFIKVNKITGRVEITKSPNEK